MNVTKNLSSFVYSHLQGAMVTVYGIFILMFLSTTMVLLSERMVVGISSSVNILKEKQAELNMRSGEDLWENLDITETTTFNSSNGWDMGEITFIAEGDVVAGNSPPAMSAIDTVYPAEKIKSATIIYNRRIKDATIKVKNAEEFRNALQDINSSSVIWVKGHRPPGSWPWLSSDPTYGEEYEEYHIPSGAKIYGGFDPEFKTRPRTDINGDGVIENWEFAYQSSYAGSFIFSGSNDETILDGITFASGFTPLGRSAITIMNDGGDGLTELQIVTGGTHEGKLWDYNTSYIEGCFAPPENMLQGEPSSELYWGSGQEREWKNQEGCTSPKCVGAFRVCGYMTYTFPTPIPYNRLWMMLSHQNGSGDIHINKGTGTERRVIKSNDKSPGYPSMGEVTVDENPGVLTSIKITKGTKNRANERKYNSMVYGIKVENADGDIAWLEDIIPPTTNSSPQIRNCFFTGNDDTFALIDNVGCSPTISDCMFTRNSIESIDPGINVGIITNRPGATPQNNATIKNCTFIDNDPVPSDWDNAEHVSTAIYNYETAPTITDCKFENNNLGIYNYSNERSMDRNLKIINCRFHGTSENNLFGIRNENTSALIIGCVFTGEHMRAVHFISSADDGTGINEDNQDIMINCTVTTESDAPAQITLEGYVWPLISNTILWNPGPLSSCIGANDDFRPKVEIMNSIVALNNFGQMIQDDGIADVFIDNTTSNDPQFELFDYPIGDPDELDLSLQADSPGKNSGSESEYWSEYNVDITGNARLYDGGIDLGAYGSRYKPGIVYVDINSESEAQDGTSWETAFSNLQHALESARYGDEIWVAQGEYIPEDGCEPVESHTGRIRKNKDEGYRFWVNRDCTFNIPAGVEVYGGFNGTELPNKFSSRDYEYNITTLSGNIGNKDDGDWTSFEDNAYHVVTFEQEKLMPAVLDGFTITEGMATGSRRRKNMDQDVPDNELIKRGNGAGIYMSYCHPILRNLIIDGNRAHESDYAMCLTNDCEVPGGDRDIQQRQSGSFSTGWRESGTVTKTGGGNGGGVFADYSNPTFSNVTVTDNFARKHGGGLAFNGCNRVKMTDVTINNNHSTASSTQNDEYYGGGGLHADSSSIYIDRFIIDGNEAAYRGGGICSIYSHLYLSNGLITGNSSSTCNSGCGVNFNYSTATGSGGEGGGGIHVMYIRDFVLEHVTIVSNSNGYDRYGEGGGMQFTYYEKHLSYVGNENTNDYNISMDYCIVDNNLTKNRKNGTSVLGHGITTLGGYNSMGYLMYGLRKKAGEWYWDNWIPSYTRKGEAAGDDPQFVDMKTPGVGGGDYHLAEDSPAKNATGLTRAQHGLHSHFKKQYDVDYNLRTPEDGDDYGGYEWSQPPQSFKIKGITGVNGDITRTTTSD